MSHKIGFLITARLKSSRLPKKLLLDIEGKSLIHHVVDRIKELDEIDTIVMCTSINPQDDELERISKEQSIECFRGNEEDVLQRLLDASEEYGLDYFIGITGENPLFSIEYTRKVLKRIHEGAFDFIAPDGLPIGCATYALNVKALRTVCRIKEVVDTEIWGYLINRPEIFNVDFIQVEEGFHWPELRITTDYPEDLAFIRKVFSQLDYEERLDLKLVLAHLKANPEIPAIHASKIQLDLDQEVKEEINEFFVKNKESIIELKNKIYAQ